VIPPLANSDHYGVHTVFNHLLVPLQAKFGVMLTPTFPRPATWYRIQTGTLSFLIILSIHGCNGRRNPKKSTSIKA